MLGCLVLGRHGILRVAKRGENSNVSKIELALAMSAMSAVRAEDVEAADEWWEEHPELAGNAAGTLPASQNSLPGTGVKPADTSPATTPAGSTPAASSTPASNPPQVTGGSQPAGDVAASTPQATV